MSGFDFVKENWKMLTTLAGAIVLAGGTIALDVRMPGHEKVTENAEKLELVEESIAQIYQQYEQQWAERGIRDSQKEIQRLDHEMRYLRDQINRLNSLEQYTGRALTSQETWTLDQMKDEWSILRDRRQELLINQ